MSRCDDNSQRELSYLFRKLLLATSLVEIAKFIAERYLTVAVAFQATDKIAEVNASRSDA